MKILVIIIYMIISILSFVYFSKKITIKNGEYYTYFIAIVMEAIVWPITYVAILFVILYILWKRRMEDE